jgi:L-alanine-DL-glutamate epimerase-like enolase superfamily enzyme
VSALDADVERVSLPLSDPFGIARGTTETAENVVVTLRDAGYAGRGVAAPSTRYGETPATVEAVLPALLSAVGDAALADGRLDPHARQAAARAMDGRVRANAAAKAAVDVALHDLAAKRLDVPLYRLLGLDPDRSVRSSFTIGLADPGEMARRARAAADDGFGIRKVKLGGNDGDDRARLEAVREAAPDARLRVDANEGWTPARAVAAGEWLAEAGVEFLEQPVPADADLGYVHEHAPIPVCADEACVTAADVPRVADACSVVNVMLAKCGGFGPARRQIATARAHGLDVMLGCMVESAGAIAAACHLAPLVDYADLDGALLLAEDPYRGVPMPGGRPDLRAVERGTGARPAASAPE